jgi:hypothetical protein
MHQSEPRLLADLLEATLVLLMEEYNLRTRLESVKKCSP